MRQLAVARSNLGALLRSHGERIRTIGRIATQVLDDRNHWLLPRKNRGKKNGAEEKICGTLPQYGVFLQSRLPYMLLAISVLSNTSLRIVLRRHPSCIAAIIKMVDDSVYAGLRLATAARRAHLPPIASTFPEDGIKLGFTTIAAWKKSGKRQGFDMISFQYHRRAPVSLRGDHEDDPSLRAGLRQV